jgi:hypothetical protein
MSAPCEIAASVASFDGEIVEVAGEVLEARMR